MVPKAVHAVRCSRKYERLPDLSSRCVITETESGKQFRCDVDQHLLQGMTRYGVGGSMRECIPVGCRGGGCGVCRIRVIEGEYESKKMSRKHVSEKEQAQSVALACRVYPLGDMRIEVLAAVPKIAVASAK